MKRTKSIQEAYELLAECRLCPRRCGVQRLDDEEGFCGIGLEVKVSSAGPHFGEEPELVGHGGSGTIFLTGCNLGCLFCQNSELSHLHLGNAMVIDDIVTLMVSLQQAECHNINFVTPTHVTPQIMESIDRAREVGLTVPIVYNCGGYESLETLRLLEGFVEVFMPDLKFMDSAAAFALAQAEDYPQVATAAVREMHRQVGDLEVDECGVATRGLLVRHLVMPGGAAGTDEAMRFLAQEISTETYVNIMDQYRPCYRAGEIAGIDRPTRRAEHAAALQIARDYDLHRGF